MKFVSRNSAQRGNEYLKLLFLRHVWNKILETFALIYIMETTINSRNPFMRVTYDINGYVDQV